MNTTDNTAQAEALRAYAAAEADALEAKVALLWATYKDLEEECRPILERVEKARHEWCVAVQRVEQLRLLAETGLAVNKDGTLTAVRSGEQP